VVAKESIGRCFFGQQAYSLRFPPARSFFSAEATVIIIALKFVISSDENKWTVYSVKR
jgi:hypothetical protein